MDPTPTPTPPPTSTAPSISVTNLTYTFPTTPPTPSLTNVTFYLPPSSRTLLIGANGAGKTTLLRLLSGKKLCPSGKILVGGVDPFATGLEGVSYLGLEWVLNPIVRHDIGVSELLDSVGGQAWRERRDELVRILDVDEGWRMNQVSDGERRRVQLCMGLVRPWVVLLLDEVTVDLDVLARSRFLGFLRGETLARHCTVVYATHIMDGLEGWPTHIVRMTLGRVRQFGTVEELSLQVRRAREMADRERWERGEVDIWGGWRNSALLDLVLGWLEEDFRERGPRGPRVAGP
ncbi:P-loop containing nucleoside triphosphate hydrolase protein [Terfezia claveryi]|nr:P-loop containing nucleoside triphosphate hydrolase protein [Terfezia claveryi]